MSGQSWDKESESVFWTGVERTVPTANLIPEQESECTKWYF